MKKKKGFTLIEIIISITLIALIASYSLFKYSEVQEKARQKLDLSAVGIFVEAVEMIRMEDEKYADMDTITSEDEKVKSYVSGELKGKSKLYSGYFVATYDDKGTLTVTSKNGKYQLYPDVKTIGSGE